MALGAATTQLGIIITANAAQAQAALANLNRSLGSINSPLMTANTGFRGLNAIWGAMAVGAGAALVTTFVKMAAELQRTQMQIAVFTRDISKVPEEFEKIIDLGRKSSFSLGTMTAAWVKLKSAGLDPIVDAQGNGPLRAISDAVAAFGGTDQHFNRATIAIQQMAGKGVISMEELRQQLGEAIPVAMRVMAEEMGISVGELIREVSSGSLEFERGMEALVRGLEKHFGGVGELMKTQLIGALNQTRLEFEVLSDVVLNQSGAMDILAATVTIFNGKIREFGNWLKSPEGQAAIEQWNETLLDIIDNAVQAASDLAPLAEAFADIGASILGMLGALPTEMLAGGLIGYLIYGRQGAAAGAILGYLSQFEGLISGITTMLDGLVEHVKSIVGEAGMEVGLLGWLLFGRKMGLILAAIAVIADKADILREMDPLSGGIEDANQIAADFMETNRQAMEQGLDTVDFSTFYDRWIKEHQQATNEIITNTEAAVTDMVAGKALEPFARVDEAFAAIAGVKQFELSPDLKLWAATAEQATVLRDRIINIADVAAQFREAQVANFTEMGQNLGLDPATLDFISNMETKMGTLREEVEGGGNAAAEYMAKVRTGVDEFNSAINNIEERLHRDPENASFWQGEIDTLMTMRDEYQQLGEQIAQTMSGEVIQDTQRGMERLNESFDQYLARGSEMEQQTQRLDSTFAGYQATLDRLRDSVDDGTLSGEEQVAAYAELDRMQERLNAAREAGISQLQEEVGLKSDALTLDIERGVKALENEANMMAMENNFDEVGIAGQEAAQRVEASLQRVQEQIVEVQRAQAEGLITEEAANSAIARLNAVQQSIQSSGTEMIENMKYQASEWGRLMEGIGRQIEDSLGDALYGLVTGTKSAKEVLTDFYNQITRMVIRYLVHQSMVGLFGGGPGGGSGFGSWLSGLFGSGGGGMFGGFAGGGGFIVGGHGGTDSQMVAFKATPGERVRVGAQGGDQQGMFGGGTVINISAVDADSVARLFMNNGDALVSVLRSRHNLNRGLG